MKAIKQLLLLAILASSTFFLLGCVEKPQISSSSNITVELSSRAGQPGSPLYNLKIDGGGNVVYSQQGVPGVVYGDYDSQTDGTSNKTSRIGRQNVENLAGFVVEKQFFSMRDRYDSSRTRYAVDVGWVKITVTIDEKSKTVVCIDNCPKEFDEIENEILKIQEETLK